MTHRHHSSGARRGRTLTGPAALVTALWAFAGPASGDITNDATARAQYGGAAISSPDASASVKVIPGAARLRVTKTASVTSGVKPGDIITYTYAVTNDGTLTVTGISLSDAHDGSGAPPVPGSEQLTADAGVSGDSTDATLSDGVWSVLAPGDTVTFTATYTVTQTDLDTRQ
jgi:uncharacterized repeat protein (TIGR01451 family)